MSQALQTHSLTPLETSHDALCRPCPSCCLSSSMGQPEADPDSNPHNLPCPEPDHNLLHTRDQRLLGRVGCADLAHALVALVGQAELR